MRPQLTKKQKKKKRTRSDPFRELPLVLCPCLTITQTLATMRDPRQKFNERDTHVTLNEYANRSPCGSARAIPEIF